MALTLYHYPNCSTCKQAIKWLVANGHEFTAIDLVAKPPTRAVLEHIYKLADVPLKKLFNLAGASYRDGDFKTKLPGMTSAQAFAALAADGKLIKRPILLGDDIALVGFAADEWQRALA